MSARRIPPSRHRPVPARPNNQAPAASGEYRITSPGRYSLIDLAAMATEAAPSGRMLDDALEFDLDVDADGALELECLPSSHGTRVETSRHSMPEPPLALAPRSPSHVILPAAPPWPMASPQPRRSSSKTAAVRTTSSSSIATHDTHAALVAFAGFGDPPDRIWGAPAYAMRVVLRRHALKKDLARARHWRSQDVPLYEASLRSADDGAVRNGLVLLGALSVLAAFAALLVFALVQVVMNALAGG